MFKSQINIKIQAIGFRIAGFCTLVAMRNDLPVYAFSQPFVEHKIFPDKFRFEVCPFYLPDVFKYSAIQLVNILKSLVFYICACFFATDSA